MALVVIVAIVAFLRHEMGGKRAREDTPADDDIDAESVISEDAGVSPADGSSDSAGQQGG